MILAVDVDYEDSSAQVAGVSFNRWDDSAPDGIYVSKVESVEAYEAGNFFKRELPCILALLEEHRLKPDVVVIDGFVYLDGHSKPGLGRHLFNSLNGEVAIVGVAKRPFKNIPEEHALYRGESKNPLYVTSAGMELSQAIKCIEQMHGRYRIPDLLKKADQTCRGQR